MAIIKCYICCMVETAVLPLCWFRSFFACGPFYALVYLFGCAANRTSAANVTSSVLENFLPFRRFLRLGKRQQSEGAKSGE
jgi:hypothetical protein